MTFVLGKGKHARDLDAKFREMAADISAQCEQDTPFHLKVFAWHENSCFPANTYLEDFKSVLMQSPHLLQKLDPDEDMDCRVLGPMVDDLHA